MTNEAKFLQFQRDVIASIEYALQKTGVKKLKEDMTVLRAELAAANTRLRPGDLLVLELGRGGAALARGDVVELAAGELGVLRNRVV